MTKEEIKRYRKEYFNRPEVKEHIKEYRLKNKERDKKQSKDNRNRPEVKEHKKECQLKHYYGITLEQHRQMFIAQDGKCAICGMNFKESHNKSKCCVDHDHETKQIRQLLCKRCMSMIGLADDNPQILSNGVDYLNKWKTNKQVI